MEDDLPRLGVVIVTYNSEAEIETCLRSLSDAARGFRTLVRVVDNASRDRTADLASKIGNALNRPTFRVEVLKMESNLGFTRAMNVGLDGLVGDAILWLNPDVALEPSSLATLWQSLQRDPQCGAVAPQLRNPDGTIQPSCRRFPRHRDVFLEIMALTRLFPRSRRLSGWKMGEFDHQAPRRVDQPQGACLLVRGTTAERVGPLDERLRMFFSDVDYCRRIYRLGQYILFDPNARATHTKGASIYPNRRRILRTSHRDFVEYFRKWYPDRRYRAANWAVQIALAIVLPFRLLGAFLRSLLVRRKQSNGST